MFEFCFLISFQKSQYSKLVPILIQTGQLLRPLHLGCSYSDWSVIKTTSLRLFLFRLVSY